MPLQDLIRFTSALAATGGGSSHFDDLHELTQRVIGAKLFSVITYDFERRVARRIYTNRPAEYPVSGTKPVNTTAWGRIVLEEHRIFVANSLEGFAPYFADHALLSAMGCESVINVPLVVRGKLLGTINCLHKAGFYGSDRVAAAEALRLPGAACLLFDRLAAEGL